MKRIVGTLILAALFLGLTAGVVTVSVNTVRDFALEENRYKTSLVQERLDETLALLTDLSQTNFIRDPAVSYRDKAALLTKKNRDEDLGYMMLRILDEDFNLYREDQAESTANLASRAYMQTLYATGVPQVTDAFLAGADGKTVNYTVAVGILEGDRVVGSLFAAIYGSELDELLLCEHSDTVLVGSQLQFMGGVPEELFGMPVAQVLEDGHTISRPAENILLDFREKRSGGFWSLWDGLLYVAYSPITCCDWVVGTQVSALPMVRTPLMVYGCGVLLLAAAGVWLYLPKKREK